MGSIRRVGLLAVVVGGLLGVVGVAPAQAADPVTTHVTLAGDGRSYDLHYDPDTSRPLPLVVGLHAANHAASNLEAMTGLQAFSDSHGFVLAYGNGLGGRWNAGSCCSRTNPDDMDYLRRLVADVKTKVAIDPRRVYVTGWSNGAMMAWRAVCEAPDVFAAAGVVSGDLLVDCAQTVTHVFHQHGTADATVPFTGGVGFEGRTFPDSRTEPDRVAPGSDVTFNLIEGGGHAWPAGTTDAVWNYLKRVCNRPVPSA
jgi:poly(3-hydroxybutyrate) depolymerase